MTRVFLISVALLAFAGPAAAQRKTHGHCSGKPIDSTIAVNADVYRDCEVDQAAKVTQRARPNVQMSDFTAGRCYRAELEFVVDTAGIPEFATARVVSTNSRTLADSTMSALMQLRYEPAKLDGKSVRQLARYTEGIETVSVSVKRGASVTNAAAVASAGRAGRKCD